MPTIPLIIQKIRVKRVLFLQLLFVALAFVLMVVSSSLYVRKMLQDHLRRQAADMLAQTKQEIESELVEPQTTLIVVSETIRSMILLDSSAKQVQEYMTDIGAQIQNKATGFQFDGIYGYFEALGGIFLHSEGWKAEDDYEPTDRPWYRAAVQANGGIGVTEPYLDVSLGVIAIT